MTVQSDSQEPRGWSRWLEMLHEAAKVIKSITVVIGAISATYIVVVNTVPTWPVLSSLVGLVDEAIAPSRFAVGFVYYEVGEQGQLTEDGQLASLNGAPHPDYEDLNPGDIVRVASQVYLRPEARSNSIQERVFGPGQCLEIQQLAVEIPRDELRTARSGGWLSVIPVPCPA